MRKSDILMGATALLLFVAAFFVLPLSVAMSLCTMPCCAAPEEAVVTPCAVECAVQADAAQAPDVKVTKIAAPPAVTPDAFDASEVVVRTVAPRSVAAPPLGVPLHLLHVTFLI